jgi:hypothetical protein
MKLRNIILAILMSSCTISIYGQQLYKGLPVVNMSNPRVNYHVYINDVENTNWTITPKFADNNYVIQTYMSDKSNITFRFKTDIDSIKFELNDNETKKFYVLLNKKYTLKSVIRQRIVVPQLSYLTTESNLKYKILYTSDNEKAYLDALKLKYPINFGATKTQIDSVMTILNWTRRQWEHKGDVSPKRNDAISILDEVKEGRRFPCFAYGIVLASQLKVSGFKSRVIYLKSKDIATSMQGGGHVATEVFVDELQKWVFVDGQFNTMPFLNNVPLNAVELQQAIRTDFDNLEFRSLGKIDKINYIDFVQPYLFYFDCAFDQRESIITQRNSVNGKRNLMLVPSGTENPAFMLVWNSKIDYCEYTNSVNDFYAKPD